MILDKLETQAVDFVARFSPWLAPLPTAYLTATATVEHLTWPLAVGIIAGAIVEALGLASVATALTLREYNQDKRKSDPIAPYALAISLAAVYFVSVTFLTVALDTAPRLATFAPLVFPVMSLAGATVLAIRADHRRRLVAIANEKAERKAKRQASKASESKPAKSQLARYVCATCGRSFGSQPALNAHQRVHASFEAEGNGKEPASRAISSNGSGAVEG